MSGFQPSDLILVAARPSMGKTAFVLNIAQYMAFKSGVTTAIFSLEMSKEQLVNRLLSLESKVDSQSIRTGNLEDEDWAKLIAPAGDFGYFQVSESTGKGTERAGSGAVPVEPCRGTEAGSQAHAF